MGMDRPGLGRINDAGRCGGSEDHVGVPGIRVLELSREERPQLKRG